MHRAARALIPVAGHRVSVLATVLMSVAALATSWAGYQASVWNGAQMTHGDASTALRTSSTQASTRAGQHQLVDIQMFTAWLAAYAAHDTLQERFYAERFRPEFAPAFRAWTASRPLQTPGAASTPFALPIYTLAADSEAARLALAADRESDASQRASAQSDSYVLDAVLLASVMFFAGGAQSGAAPRVRRVLMVVAFALCAAALYRLATSPVAGPAPFRSLISRRSSAMSRARK